MKQNLCEYGKRLRGEFIAMTIDIPAQTRYRIMQAYFWHKQKCMDCNVTWLKGENSD